MVLSSDWSIEQKITATESSNIEPTTDSQPVVKRMNTS